MLPVVACAKRERNRASNAASEDEARVGESRCMTLVLSVFAPATIAQETLNGSSICSDLACRRMLHFIFLDFGDQ